MKIMMNIKAPLPPYLAREVDVLVPPGSVGCLTSEVLLSSQPRVGWVVEHPCGVHQHLAVVLLPT